jgi:hypothetical protein
MNRLFRAPVLMFVFLAGCQSITTAPAGALDEKTVRVNGVSLSYIEQG